MTIDVVLWSLFSVFLSCALFRLMGQVTHARRRHRMRKTCEAFRRARR